MALLVILMPSISYAKWVEIGVNQDHQVTIYIDDPIKKKLNIAKVNIMYDYQYPSKDRGIKHSSEIEVIEVDCKRHQFILKSVDWFYGASGAGRVVWHTQNLDSQFIEPTTAYAQIETLVCRK